MFSYSQDCNTQSVNGVYTNTVVVQRHSVVMTKTDKIYKVRCTYDTSSRNITFGMMPIRDPDMISITSAPEAPAPRYFPQNKSFFLQSSTTFSLLIKKVC